MHPRQGKDLRAADGQPVWHVEANHLLLRLPDRTDQQKEQRVRETAGGVPIRHRCSDMRQEATLPCFRVPVLLATLRRVQSRLRPLRRPEGQRGMQELQLTARLY